MLAPSKRIALIVSALVSSPRTAWPRQFAAVWQCLDRFAGCLAGLACAARLPRLRPGTNVQAILGEFANWDSNTVLIHHGKF